MEKLAINFVLAFARDLQKLMDALQEEFGYQLINANAFYKKKIQEKASILTKELVEKYKTILDLKISVLGGLVNIVLETPQNEEILIPRQYLDSPRIFDHLNRLNDLLNHI